jgi:single-stranded DNA-binding protein
MYETRGTLKMIGDIQTFGSGFTKREFVVTTAHDKYPQDLKFEIVKDKCALLDSFEQGQEVVVNFDIRGNEYQGRYYVNLSCWKIQPANGQSGEAPAGNAAPARRPQQASSSQPEPSAADLRNEEDFDDEIPF